VQPADEAAPSAGLVADSAKVFGGPPAVGTVLPLTASVEASFGFTPIRSDLAALRPQLLGLVSSRLLPFEVTVPAQLAPPPFGFETIVFWRPRVPALLRLAPVGAVLAVTVSLTSVAAAPVSTRTPPPAALALLPVNVLL
jgi:hypothetical protein